MIMQIFLFILVNIFLFKIKPDTISKCIIWIILLLLIPPILIVPSYSIMNKEAHIKITQEELKEVKPPRPNLKIMDGASLHLVKGISILNTI